MCTLLVLHRCFPEAPLVIAANRDEYHDRPAEGPALRPHRGRMLLAPRDLRGGGTWLGWNDLGMFAALTNRPSQALDPQRRSRGHLVTDVLAEASAKEAMEHLVGLEPDVHNPCNVFVADGLAAYAIVLDGGARVQELAPGPHVIGNADPNDRTHPKVGRLMGELEAAAADGVEGVTERLACILRMHGPENDTRSPLEATCIHAGAYGTRSSTLFVRGYRSQEDRLLYATGAPCTTSYEDMTPFLGELDRAAGTNPGDLMRNPS
ncbi:MAG: NRDE family protein [bacterium]|nr:NRDE family protein [bacterium]MCP5065613.1 NRDE family protein [bacterium]